MVVELFGGDCELTRLVLTGTSASLSSTSSSEEETSFPNTPRIRPRFNC